MNEIIARLFNIHTLKAIAAILVSMGLLTSEQVDQTINGSGGNVTLIVIGIAVYVAYALFRKGDAPESG